MLKSTEKKADLVSVFFTCRYREMYYYHLVIALTDTNGNVAFQRNPDGESLAQKSLIKPFSASLPKGHEADSNK